MAKAATFKRYTGSAWEELTFTPSSHTHTIANITGLQNKINNYDERISYYDGSIAAFDERLIALEENSSSGGSTGGAWVKTTNSITLNSSTPLYIKVESLLGSGMNYGIPISEEGDLGFQIYGEEDDPSYIIISFDYDIEEVVATAYLAEGTDNIYVFTPGSVFNGAVTVPITTNTAYFVEQEAVEYIPLTGTSEQNPITGNLHFYSDKGIAWDQNESFGIFFDQDGYLCFNNPDDRSIGFSTQGVSEDAYWYSFPAVSGTVVLEETATNHHKFKLLGQKTLTASGYMDLSTTNYSNYNELMIIVRATAAATIGIDDATTASSSGFGASKAVSGTSYTKITMNKTSDNYYAWDVGGSLLWTSSTTYKYIRAYTTASSISVTIKVYGR